MAASLIVEGLDDYVAARSKAAAALSMTHVAPMPDVEEIDAAVAAHINLFSPAGRPELLREIRNAALEIMHRTEAFHPRLFGPVLTGTATRFSAIDLELGIDAGDNKEFEFFLLNTGWPHEVVRPARSSTLVYEIDADGAPVRVVLAGRHWQHASPHWRGRADARALAELLGE